MATDLLEAKALSFNRNYIDIYSNSWGPNDNGFEVDGPGRLTQIALEEGAEKVCCSNFIKVSFERHVIYCRIWQFLRWPGKDIAATKENASNSINSCLQTEHFEINKHIYKLTNRTYVLQTENKLQIKLCIRKQIIASCRRRTTKMQR